MDLEKLKNIIKPTEYIGLQIFDVTNVLPLDSNEHDINSLTWVNERNIDRSLELSSTSLILPYIFFNDNEIIKKFKANNINLFFAEKPRMAFSAVLKEFSAGKVKPAKIETSASISSDVEIGKNCYIGNNVVIEAGCKIGDYCIILHNTVILENTIIGNNVSIGCNCTVGGVGFGYELNESGEYELISHLGNVVISDNVEIGNNTAIDRAVLGSTIIGNNVKIDNLVHVAHGVKIGDNSLIIANSMIAGSTVVENDVWVAPSASILNKLKIGKGSLIGMGAVVIKNVEDDSIIAGNPGKFLKKRNS
jgi:UDP-3-O-[3-hydroxymyristoyl] glucosamine N-acyltransferase